MKHSVTLIIIVKHDFPKKSVVEEKVSVVPKILPLYIPNEYERSPQSVAEAFNYSWQ